MPRCHPGCETWRQYNGGAAGGRTGGRAGGWADGRTGGRADGRTGGRADGRTRGIARLFGPQGGDRRDLAGPAGWEVGREGSYREEADRHQ